MIVEASKYADVRGAGRQQPRATHTSGRRSGSPSGAPAILVPKHEALVNWDEWLWRELREGGYLHAYIAREKATSARRLRSVAKQMNGFRQNNQSEHRLLAAIPAREFHRWKKEDPHFWEDDANLRSFRRDNPDAQIFL